MPTIYKTKDGTQVGFVPGVGEIVNGRITVPDEVILENANLEKVEEQPQVAPAAPVSSSLPAPVASNPPVSPPPADLANQANQVNKDTI